MRGCCAVAVFAFHILYLQPLSEMAPWAPATWGVQYGYLGVPIFFMISGYVISLSASAKSRRDFAVGRAARLMPAYWLALGLTITASPGLTLAQLIANLPIAAKAFGQPYMDPVFWSLTAEIIFYSCAFLLIGERFETRLRIFTAAWLTVSVISVLLHLPGSNLTNANWAPYFAVGIYAYLSSTARRDDRIMLALSALWSVAITQRLAGDMGREAVSPSVAALLCLAGIVLFLFAIGAKLSDTALTRIVGATSYPLYLIHFVFGGAVIVLAYNTHWALVPPAALLVVALAVVITRCETPLARQVKRLAEPRSVESSIAAAP